MDVTHVVDINDVTGERNTCNCLCGDYIEENERHSFKEMLEEFTTCPKCIRILCRDLNEISNMRDGLEYFKSSFERSIRIIDTMISRQRYNLDINNGKENEKSYEEGSYPFIPHSTIDTFNEFKHLNDYLWKESRWSGDNNRRDSKFLDAGCGIGNVMLMARELGLCSTVHGIEYSEHVYKAAKQWLGLSDKVIEQYGGKAPLDVFKDDILKFKKYKDYDIIYFYCPFSNRHLQVMFEELIEDKMKVGAILIPRLKQGKVIHEDSRFEKIQINVEKKNGNPWPPFVNSNIFIKIKSGKRSKSEFEKIRNTDGGNPKIFKKYKLLKS